MSSEQERLARQWAERAKNSKYFDEYADDAAAAAEHILATTTPLSMADVEWEDEKHYLAGAVASDGTEVVMLWWDHYETGQIICHNAAWYRGELTPNGKRYELREIGATAEPEHPATLVTEQDYENAPEGTIVAVRGYDMPLRKHERDLWSDPHGYKFTNERLAGIIRNVKRWGWGE